MDIDLKNQRWTYDERGITSLGGGVNLKWPPKMHNNILIHSRHVRGIHNNLADNLSRLQIQTFLREFPSARHIPTAIPSHLLPT